LCLELHRRGLTAGGAGNVSACREDRVAVSPSGFRLADVRPRHVTVVDAETGERVVGTREPTSELPMHLSVYERVGEGVVLHFHSPWVTEAAHTLREVKATEDLRRSVGSVEWIEYRPPGSEELARAVGRVARKPMAAVLERHGGLVVGEDPMEALSLAEALEEAARLSVKLRP
ncbi:MAG: class II aldolase/adducin family protein, partial [Euryarchaeota archaeon]